MRKWNILILSFLLLLGPVTAALGRSGVEIDYTNPKYLDDGNKLPLELTISNFSGVPVSEVSVFYRYSGEGRFRSMPLQNEGFRYFAGLKLDPAEGSMVEYYYHIRYMDQRDESLPADAVAGNLFRTPLQYDRDYGDDILIISPEDGEQIFASEIVITASFTRIAEMIDVEKTRVYLNTWDVSKYLKKFGDFISFAPRQVPTGSHKIRIELYDKNNVLVASKEWAFTAMRSRALGDSEKEYNVSGRFFAEGRRENLRDGNEVTDYNQSGLQLNGSYRNLSYSGRLYFSNQEEASRQPVNRYSGYAKLHFWNERYLKLGYGDAYPRYNPMIFQNILLRGFHSTLALKFLNVDFALGKTLRSIEGKGTITTGTQGNQVVNVLNPGTYKREIMAVRPSFGAGKKFQLGFTFLKGKDDTTSIQYGRNPQQNAALGADVFLGLDRQRVMFEGNVNASVYNRNITGGSIPYDTLQAVFEGDVIEEKFYNYAKKLITVNQYVIPRPGIAYQGRLRLRYFQNNLSFLMESVDEDFYSLGQPYLLRDNRGFHIVDNISLYRNQVYVTLGYRKYRNNLQNVKSHTTNNRNLYVNVSYFPMANLPEITFAYNTYSRDNGVSEDSLNSLLNRPEDNKTNSINFSTNYRFQLMNLDHRIGASLMTYRRTDIFKFAENNSDYLSFNFRTNFNVPLQTLLELILQQTESGKDTDRESTLDVTTFGVGANYTLKDVFTTDRLFMAMKVRFGNLSSVYKLYEISGGTSDTKIEYSRNYFSFKIQYSIPRLGDLGLTADLLTYSGDRDYKDIIYTARYNYNF